MCAVLGKLNVRNKFFPHEFTRGDVYAKLTYQVRHWRSCPNGVPCPSWANGCDCLYLSILGSRAARENEAKIQTLISPKRLLEYGTLRMWYLNCLEFQALSNGKGSGALRGRTRKLVGTDQDLDGREMWHGGKRRKTVRRWLDQREQIGNKWNAEKAENLLRNCTMTFCGVVSAVKPTGL